MFLDDCQKPPVEIVQNRVTPSQKYFIEQLIFRLDLIENIVIKSEKLDQIEKERILEYIDLIKTDYIRFFCIEY